ncbi:MAG: HDIG domain-containing protein [Planctomycetaceae bacterium]|nr:HDIG domain-containing protein [Planctomycetaceae bacterium]
MMSLFGSRRSRQTRVFRPTPSTWEKLTSSLQDYRVLTLLLIALFAVLSLLIAVQSWKSRFPYREGQIVATGIQSRVDFQIENVGATLRAVAEAENSARLVFVRDNDLWDTFDSTFREELSRIANATTINDLDQDVIASFGLDVEIPGDVEKGTEPTTRFEMVRSALTETETPVADRLAAMGQEFAALLGSARGTGLIADEEIQATGLTEADTGSLRGIQIVDDQGEPVSYNLLVEVRIEDQLLNTGNLGSGWVTSPNLQQIRPAVESWIRGRIRGVLTYDDSASNELRIAAKEEVETQTDEFTAGQMLVTAGSIIEADKLSVLREEYLAHEMSVTFGQRMARIAGASSMLTMMVVLFGIYLVRHEAQLLTEIGRLIAFVLICSASVALSGLLSQDPWRAEVIPLLAAVMIVAIVHNQMMAILTAFCLCLLVTMSTVAEIGHFACLMAVCFTAIIPLQQVSSRSTLIKVGFLVAGVAIISVIGVSFLAADNFPIDWQSSATLMTALKFAGWSLVCCYIVAGSLPFIESAFDIVTDISLLELTDVSHPLLQELARRAPGTYNHSISVASLGEAAADAIGANGLLLRVGAYFHDIGKGMKPEYFIENMTAGQENPHSKLAPAMSALIIIGHVKDGVEMAEQYNLPRRLIDFIEQHHGTTLVEYFYREAANRADEDHRTDADESTFRYPGPRPQTKETGVMMLADAVESASRTLSEPTPARIQSLVHEITLKRVHDGQFDECGLTMREIHVVQESLVKSLLAVHHGRVKYPDQKTA